MPCHPRLLVAAFSFLAYLPSCAETTLHNTALEISFRENAHHLSTIHISDRINHVTLDLPEAFILTLKDGVILRSSEMTATPTGTDTVTKVCRELKSSRIAAPLSWCALVDPASQYVRFTLAINAGSKPLPLSEVRLLDFHDPEAHIVGAVKGSPIVSGNMFFGFEHPLSQATISQGHVSAFLHRDLPLQAGQGVSYSAVTGAARPDQLRRTFLRYIEQERPRRYSPFLHYNSWYDLGYTNRFDEAGALDRIHAFGTELEQKRHVKLASFLFDDGWDDPNTLWGFNSGFPDGFTKVAADAARYHAGIGVWLSPWGGYDKQKEQRIAYGKQHGYEILNEGYALSGPRYYKAFEDTCLEMINRFHVNQFKFDGTGNANRVFPGSAFDSDFDAAIHLIQRLRRQDHSLFINLTTGTTPSPFWLFYADSIWRGGEDHDFTGVGSSRQRWITYRDAQTYKNIVQGGPLFPLNSLMLHGIIYARQADGLMTDPGNEFADEVHSYFGSGTQLQEMYITPALLTPQNWDTLAASARWSEANAGTLEDVHWIGGDPNKLQVYGWAAWSPKKGIITLRNPSDKAADYTLEIGHAFELPQDAPVAYKLTSVWAAKNVPGYSEARKGQLMTVHLQPFEVLTLEADPR